MERLLAMYQPFCVAIFLSVSLCTAFAQSGTHDAKTSAGHVTEPDSQARRVALRRALQAQRVSAPVAQTGARGERQLSAKERGELRQQLRQQRRESAKP